MDLKEIFEERKRRSDELKKLRLSKGISQERLAEISGLSWPTIVRLESGKKEWRIDSELIYIKTLDKLDKQMCRINK